MFTENGSTNIFQSNKIYLNKEQMERIPFWKTPSYATLLQRLGLREIKDGDHYSLTQQEENSWTPSLESVAAAIQEMQAEGGFKTQMMLSVLGFVIEKMDHEKKIHPDICTFMCREAITHVILERFNQTIASRCTNLTELSYKINDNIDEANEIFNSIKLCDPAMGTGTFLVTLLNELIAIKSQLGILADKKGNPLFQYKIVVHENELVVFEKKRFKIHTYNPHDPESQRIQKTLFHEKRYIIENCLYGVDIDPTAVTICRLRLWLEQLKQMNLHETHPMKLPFIETNIRCGDALVSRVSLQENLVKVFKRVGYSASEYKSLSNDYKSNTSPERKNNIEQMLSLIKEKLQLEITWNDFNNEELLKWQRELTRLNSPSLFEMEEEEVKATRQKRKEAQMMVERYKQKIEESKNNPVFAQSIEWRYEFPELLNENGDFLGFDLIIGNPPDTQGQLMGDLSDLYKQMNYRAYKRTGDVSSLFYELGNNLLKPYYYLSYITSNSWMKSVSANKMRQYLIEETNPLLMIEFSPDNALDKSASEQGVTFLQKSRNQHRMMSCQIKDDFDPKKGRWRDYIQQQADFSPMESVEKAGESITAFAILTDTEKQIKRKIEQTGTPLDTWDIEMHSGIKTGLDKAYLIDGKTKDDFILADYKNVDIIKPLLLPQDIGRYTPEHSDCWLICIPWHFPLLYDTSITASSTRAEMRFRQQYPIIYEHLLKYKEALISRNSSEVGVSFEWYALQHVGSSNKWDHFTQQKIVWKRETAASNFCLDYGGCAVLDNTCFITGQHLKYLLGVLNSKLGRYMLRDSPRLANGDMQISILTLEALKIPLPNIKIESEVISLVNRRTAEINGAQNDSVDNRINGLIYDMYHLNDEEIHFIETHISYDD